MIVEPTNEELQATEDLYFINDNEEPQPIKDMNEDHWTYIMIYNRALDTKAKRDAINKRKMALKMS